MDLHQNTVPTLPLLVKRKVEEIEEEILSTKLNVGVLIPALYSDFSQPEMFKIMQFLSETKSISRVFIVLDKASLEEFRNAFNKVREVLGDKGTVIWNDNPALKEIRQNIAREFVLGQRGKGMAVWMGLGYIIGRMDTPIVVMHDADIKTYSPYIPLLLAYPIAKLKYAFTKGYYARFGDRLFGRVVRLFYFPIIRTLKMVFGTSEFLEFLGDFRYPLSGEMGGYVSIFRNMRIPSDWGMEVSILSEAYRVLKVKSIAQVQVAYRYDHKHRSREDLRKMVVDIFKTFLVELASNGVVFPSGIYKTLKHTYINVAKEYVETYMAVSIMNGLKTNIHREYRYIEIFSDCIEQAIREFENESAPSPKLPIWDRVEAALPGTLLQIVDAVEESKRMI